MGSGVSDVLGEEGLFVGLDTGTGGWPSSRGEFTGLEWGAGLSVGGR